MKYDVFISCKSEDYNIGRQVYEFLVNHRDVNLNVFMADKELRRRGNADYGRVIDEALDSSTHLIIVASNADYLKEETSSYVYEEWHTFVEEIRSGRKKGNILTIFTDDVNVKKVPIALRNRQSFPFTEFSPIIDYLPKIKDEVEPMTSMTAHPSTEVDAPSFVDDIELDLDYDDAIDFMQDGELQDAMRSLQASFENGNSKTIPLFNKLLFQDFGKTDWDEETWEFLEQQAEAGHSFAHLAFFYKYQHDKQLHKKAIEHLKAALADKQNGYAFLCEGIAREKGIGTRANLRSAMKRYEQAYKMGIFEACSYVAEMYLNGNSGLEINEEKAIEILKNGYEQNDARSCYILGSIYGKKAHIRDNWEKAVHYFQKAVELQEHKAWIKLGDLHKYNRFAEDYNGEALNCYLEALKSGIKDAHAYIAKQYWDDCYWGDAVVEAQRGEREGNVSSISVLGSFYEEGLQKDGHWIREAVPDLSKAWDYYQKAFKIGGRIEDAVSMARLYVKEEYRPQGVSWEIVESYLKQAAQIPIIEALELMIEALKKNGREKDTVKYLKIGAESGSLPMMHEYGIYLQSSDSSKSLRLIEDAGENNYLPSVEWLMGHYNTPKTRLQYNKWMEKAADIGIDVPLEDYIPYIVDKNSAKAKKYLTKKYSTDNLEPLFWMAKYYKQLEIDNQWLTQELKCHYMEISVNLTSMLDIYAEFLIDTDNDEEYSAFLRTMTDLNQNWGEYFALHKEVRGTNGGFSKEIAQKIYALSQNTHLAYEWRKRAKDLLYMDISDRKNTKILIVDDALPHRLLLKILLTNAKYNVCTANDGKSGLEAVQREKPDLILLDVMMSGLNGFEVASILKSNPETRDISIIFLTALNSPADMVKGFQIGADDFLTKPFDKEELIARVSRVVLLAKLKKILPTEKRPTNIMKKILIVDDVVSNILLLKVLFLNEKRYQVVTANCGNKCIEQAKKERPDMILLDVMMPDINGFDVAVTLKKDFEARDIPIIFLTALSSPADLVKAFQVGADDFLSKPFNKEELLMRVKRTLDIHGYLKQIFHD